MRLIVFGGLLLMIAWGSLLSCNKWKDKKAVNDPRLTNPYCNDPNAVNYNVGFPGKPDNTICIYPTDLFRGTYLVKDSIYKDDTLFIRADSFLMTIQALSQTKLSMTGFCPSGSSLSMTAGISYIATIDTNVGDTTTRSIGQTFCRIQDTITGTLTRDLVDTTKLRINFQVVSDTGVTSYLGHAMKQ